MADEKKTPAPGQSEQTPPAVPCKLEVTIPPVEKPEQITLDEAAAPAGTDKPKTDPPSEDAGKIDPAPVAAEPVVPVPKKEKPVILKLSEVHPFHTFREHPFKVVDDSSRMKELVSSIKEQGVFTPRHCSA